MFLCFWWVLIILLWSCLQRNFVGLGLLAGGTTLYGTVLYWSVDVLHKYWVYVVVYVLLSGFISFAVLYIKGVSNPRTMDILCWTLQLLGVGLLYCAASSTVTSILLVGFMLLTYVTPLRWGQRSDFLGHSYLSSQNCPEFVVVVVVVVVVVFVCLRLCRVKDDISVLDGFFNSSSFSECWSQIQPPRVPPVPSVDDLKAAVASSQVSEPLQTPPTYMGVYDSRGDMNYAVVLYMLYY